MRVVPDAPATTVTARLRAMAQARSQRRSERRSRRSASSYDFDEPCAGGRSPARRQGRGLAEMTALGVPVPAGFTITTDACRAFMAAGGELPRRARGRGLRARPAAGAEGGQALRRPVRSAAAVGALGCGDLDAGDDGHDPQSRSQRRVGAAASPTSTGNERFARDSYRRLIQMYGEVVDGVDAESLRGRAGHRSRNVVAPRPTST